jgi:hypothetical protein
VLGHQSDAARSATGANIVLIGDSSCLTSVDAVHLGRLLPGRPRVINLALYSGIALRIYGEIAAEYLRTNRESVRSVVLLVTAGKLTDPAETTYFDQMWREIHSAAAGPTYGRETERWREVSGLSLFENRCLPRLLARPLKGGMAERFGFTAGVLDHLRAHHGTGVHVGTFRPPPHPVDLDAPITRVITRESGEIRKLIPPPVRLVAGIMPVPEGLPREGYSAVRDRLLEDWNRHLAADHLLRELPATLPDVLFANDSHVTEAAQPHFTRRLAALLAPLVE